MKNDKEFPVEAVRDVQIGVRMSQALAGELDRRRRKMSQETGIRVTRADFLRWLIENG